MNKIGKVLLIDDSMAVNNINESLLESMGYFDEIIKFTNANEAIATLKNSSNHEGFTLPGIIFLDISMPQVDGFEFLDQYIELDEAADSEYKPVVVIVSDYLDADNFTKSKEYKSYGVVEHLRKPMDKEDVKILLEEHFDGFTV